MKRKFFFLTLFLVLMLTLSSACSALSLVNPPPANQSDQDGDQEAGDEGELLTCFHVKDYTLSFDHTLTVIEAETNLTHILRSGSIALHAEADPGKYDTLLSTINPQTLNFEYMGVVGPCSVEAGGTVTVSAEGFCDVGVVYLNIKEDWAETEGTMTCDDATVPFSVPGQAFTHSGASGMGEEFLVTNDGAGHTLMKPFLRGEGYHSWTLAADPFGVVPLIDPE
jgi:hypothetical protein